MNEKSHTKPAVPDEILIKIRFISEDLTQATDNCGNTAQPLIDVIHRQTRELALVYHQLCHLHSEKEGNYWWENS